MYKVADIYCGCGGFSEGFRLAGYEIAFAVDKWEPAVITHQVNHPNSKTVLDDVIRISKLPDDEFHKLIPNTEIMLGSPPCTYFSNSNKSGNGDKSFGVELIKAYLRIVARKKFMKNSILKHWILENVPNVEDFINAEYNLRELGIEKSSVLKVKYASSRVYNAKYFGVASNRRRYLCGDFPEPIETIRSEKDVKVIKDILMALGEPDNYANIKVKDPNYDFVMNKKDVTDHLYILELAEFEWKKAKRAKQDKGYMGKMCYPEDLNKPSRTIMATMSCSSRESMVYHYKENRYRLPTIREIASLMSYPIDYRFYGKSKGIKYRLVGNSVPPKMAYALAEEINQRNKIRTRTSYKPISFNRDDFYDLNFKKFELKKEKPKRNNAKFKYHIPYLIINSYRIELTNYHSDFNNLDFEWTVEIHRSQGKKNAKVFTPVIDNSIFQDSIKNRIDIFVNEVKKKIRGANDFQKIYCRVSKEISEEGEIGPYELLDKAKVFIEKVLDKEDFRKNMTIDMEPFNLPKAILLGYVILDKIIN